MNQINKRQPTGGGYCNVGVHKNESIGDVIFRPSRILRSNSSVSLVTLTQTIFDTF